jgi:uncharacterized damage-inducible protein DinB
MSVTDLFIECSARKLRQQSGRIATCLSHLSERQIWARGGENENAVGNLVLHLAGNVRQWILTGLGGQPDGRAREREFSAREGPSAPGLTVLLTSTVEEAAALIGALTGDRLTLMYEIQKYRVSGVEAVLHVVEHFSYHAGQIIFATKAMTGSDLGFYRHLEPSAQATSAHSEKTP